MRDLNFQYVLYDIIDGSISLIITVKLFFSFYEIKHPIRYYVGLFSCMVRNFASLIQK